MDKVQEIQDLLERAMDALWYKSITDDAESPAGKAYRLLHTAHDKLEDFVYGW